ncbi:MAG: hypothetical protein U0326_14750 [Polyangiales bacterium]
MLAVMAAPAVALAQRADSDGVYGRFDGDLVLSAELMGAYADTPTGGSGTASAAIRARFMDMTGLALGYDRAIASARHDAVWLAVDLRPAWLARTNYDWEQGPRWLDLALDSIGVGWAARGCDRARPCTQAEASASCSAEASKSPRVVARRRRDAPCRRALDHLAPVGRAGHRRPRRDVRSGRRDRVPNPRPFGRRTPLSVTDRVRP